MVNFIFALWIAFMPIIQSFSDVFGLSEILCGEDFNITIQMTLFGIFYAIYAIVKFSISNKKRSLQNFKGKFKFSITYLVSALIVLIFISSFINGFNTYSFIYLSYFMIFYCVYTLNKDQIGIFMKIILTVIAISCVLGFIDPYNAIIPGFYEDCYELSTHFWNPNYTAYIVSAALGFVIIKLNYANKHKQYFFYGLLFSIFAIYLFMNGSFSPITAVFVLLIFLIIYYWIREKKFPVRFSLMFLAMILANFLVDLFPNVNEYRTCKYNYLLECVGVVDNLLGTDLLSLFNITKINGSDGWNRNELLMDSINALNPANGHILPFFFGYGAGYFSNLRPHVNYVGIALDFGVIVGLLYFGILIYLCINFFKKKRSKKAIAYISAFMIFLFNSFFGTCISYWMWFYMCILAICFKYLKEEEIEG